MASRRCIACGRVLSNEASVQRGYGPECYAKIRGATPVTRPDHETLTIVDQALAARSEKALRVVLARILREQAATYRMEDGVFRCSCGAPLHLGDLDHFDHSPGGLRLPGYGAEQWAILHCDKCRYDLAIWKVGVTQDQIDAELDRQRGYRQKAPVTASTTE